MISVIIPVYNGEKTLARCLTSLESQTVPRDKYEIIVVDDGSKDNTRKVAEGFSVDVVSQKNQGPAAARNLGVKTAKGDTVLFIDADCEATPDWIDEMTNIFRNPEIVGGKGIYKTHQKEIIARFVQIEYEERYERMKRYPYIDFIDTYSAGFRRDVFLSYGGYNTSFPTASVEDQEFSFRLGKANLKMVFNPNAIVYHKHKSSLTGYLKRKFLVAYWKVLVLKDHPAKLGHDSHTPQILKFQILLLCALIISLFTVPFVPEAIFIPATIMGIFFITTIPFISFSLKRDRMVSLISPFVLFMRSLVFCLGLVTGIYRLIFRRKGAPKPQ